MNAEDFTIMINMVKQKYFPEGEKDENIKRIKTKGNKRGHD